MKLDDLFGFSRLGLTVYLCQATGYVDQAVFDHFCLPNAGINGIHCHTDKSDI